MIPQQIFLVLKFVPGSFGCSHCAFKAFMCVGTVFVYGSTSLQQVDCCEWMSGYGFIIGFYIHVCCHVCWCIFYHVPHVTQCIDWKDGYSCGPTQAFKHVCIFSITILCSRNCTERWVEFLSLSFVKGCHSLRPASRHSVLSWRYNWTIFFPLKWRANSLREEGHSGLQQTSANTCRDCRVGNVCIQLLVLKIILCEHKLEV